jgi:hypothetical protein
MQSKSLLIASLLVASLATSFATTADAEDPEYHISANLLKGTEENYRWLGVDWPEKNWYLLIGLSGDADIKTRKPMQTGVVNGWRCRYDLQTGKFDVPPLFSNGNAKAVVPQ